MALLTDEKKAELLKDVDRLVDEFRDDPKQFEGLKNLFEQYHKAGNNEYAAAIYCAMTTFFLVNQVQLQCNSMRFENMNPAAVDMFNELMPAKWAAEAAKYRQTDQAKGIKVPDVDYEVQPKKNKTALVKFEDRQKPIELEKPNSDAARTHRGPAFRNVSIESITPEDGEDQGNEGVVNLPNVADQPNKTTYLAFKTSGYPHTYHMILQATFKKDSRDVGKATIRFWPGGLFDLSPQMWDVEIDTSNLDNDDDSNAVHLTERFITIKFKTEGGVVHQLYGIDVEGLDTDSLAIRQELCKLDHSLGRRVTIKLKIRVKSTDADHELFMKNIQALMNGTPQRQSKAYRAYCDNSGNPNTIFAAFVSRYIIRNKIGFLVEIPALKSFNTMQQWALHFVTGANSEYNREYQLTVPLQEKEQHVSFYEISANVILAAVDLSSEIRVEKCNILPIGTICRLTVELEGGSSWEDTVLSAQVVDNLFGLASKYATMLVLPPYDSNISMTASKLGTDGPKEFFTSVEIDVSNQPPLRRMKVVDTMLNNTICKKWWPLILCRAPQLLEAVTIADIENDPRAKLAWRAIMDRSAIDWNNGQKEALTALLKTHGGIAIITGVPGSGKSLMICAAVYFMIQCGGAAMITVPSNAAGDAIVEKMIEYTEQTGLEIPFVRVYRKGSELRQFVEDATGKQSFHDQIADKYDETIQHAAYVQFIMGFTEKSTSKRYKLAEHSVEQIIIDRVRAEGTAVEFTCPIFKKNAERLQKTFPRWDGHVDRPDPAGKPSKMVYVQGYDLLKMYLGKLQDEPDIRDWEPYVLRTCQEVFEFALRREVANSPVVITTSVNAGEKPISSDFGRNSDFIVAFHDEHFRDDELSSLIPATALAHREKVKALYFFGDREQPGPLVVSAKESPKYNEFARQLSKPLGTRLAECKFPVVDVRMQYRMRPILAEFPNMLNYKGRMLSSPITSTHQLKPGFEQMMCSFLKGKTVVKSDVGRVVLSVKNSDCFKPEDSTSRVNPGHLQLIVDLIIRNAATDDSYTGKDICIICMYSAQVTQVRKLLWKLADQKVLTTEDIPAVETTQGMQDGKAKWVIADPVVSSAQTASDLGHTGDHKLFNVMVTRASEAVTILLPKAMATHRLYKKNVNSIVNYKGGMPRVAPLFQLAHAITNGYLYEVEAASLPAGLVLPKKPSWDESAANEIPPFDPNNLPSWWHAKEGEGASANTDGEGDGYSDSDSTD